MLWPGKMRTTSVVKFRKVKQILKPHLFRFKLMEDVTVTIDDIHVYGRWKKMSSINHVSQYTNADYEEGDKLLVNLKQFSTERFGTFVRAEGESMAVVQIMGDTQSERIVPLTSIEPITVTNPKAKESAIERKKAKEDNKKNLK